MILDNKTYQKIKVLSNEYRFKIFEIVSKKSLNISQISQEINLSYDKCREYIKKLEEVGLVRKETNGREAFIKAEQCVLFKKCN